MKTILIDEDLFWAEVNKLEEKRAQYPVTSIEHAIMDDKILTILNLIKDCTVKGNWTNDKT